MAEQVSKAILRNGGPLFVPNRFCRVSILNWLKRIHAWTGFWGALIFLMMGISGFFLNHRDVLKIETGKPIEVSAMDIAVPPGSITNPEALGAWAKKELNLRSEPRPPREKPGSKAPASFLGKARDEAKTWAMEFNHPDGQVKVSYVPGAASVAVKQTSQNPINIIKNLHKGVGAGAAWVLFLDTIAGALIAMALTGILLWTRLHGTRLLAAGIIGACAAFATTAVWPFML